jgi:hypothetical protein
MKSAEILVLWISGSRGCLVPCGHVTLLSADSVSAEGASAATS